MNNEDGKWGSSPGTTQELEVGRTRKLERVAQVGEEEKWVVV